MLEGDERSAVVHEQLDADPVARHPALEHDRGPGRQRAQSGPELLGVGGISDHVRPDRPISEHLAGRDRLEHDRETELGTDVRSIRPDFDHPRRRYGDPETVR